MRRYVEDCVRGKAVASLQTTAKVFKAQAEGDDERYAHIDTADKNKVQPSPAHSAAPCE